MEYINSKNDKCFRLLNLYERFNRGERLSKYDMMELYGVSEKSVKRDISDLRSYIANMHDIDTTLLYDRNTKLYYLGKLHREWFESEEIISICKILLESRALNAQEMNIVLQKLINQTIPQEQDEVKDILMNELSCYIPLCHGKELLSPIWDFTTYINHKKKVEITYQRQDLTCKSHTIKPVALMFSEFYFYVIAFLDQEEKRYPTTFRLDRILRYEDINEYFVPPYYSDFNEGEFRKRVQFMYAGPLKHFVFKYSGPSVEAVLDRLPTATIIDQKDGVYTISAQSYGNGIKMWLNMRKEYVEIVEEK